MATASGSRDAQWERNRGPRISLGVSSFGALIKSGQLGLLGFLELARASSHHHVELCDRLVTPRTRADGLEALQLYGLDSPSFAIRNDFTSSDIRLDDQISHAVDGFESAAQLGASVIRVWTGATASGDIAKQRVRTAFTTLVDEATSRRLHLSIETHGGLSNDANFLRDLIDAFGIDQVGVCLDWGNMPAPTRDVLVAELAPLTTHMHVKTLRFDAAGNEVGVNAARHLAAVRDRLASIIAVVEYEGSAPHVLGVAATKRLLEVDDDGCIDGRPPLSDSAAMAKPGDASDFAQPLAHSAGH